MKLEHADIIEDAGPKLILLMEGLEIENIDDFIRRAKLGDYRNLGRIYYQRAKELIQSNAKVEARDQ
jgi:hypothetical protein